MSGIHLAVVKLLFSGWFVGSSDIGREFQRSGLPARVRSSDVSHFNCLGGFTVLVIPDVSGIDTGRVRYLPNSGKIVVLGLVRREFRHKSGVPMVGSPNKGREFRRLAL